MFLYLICGRLGLLHIGRLCAIIHYAHIITEGEFESEMRPGRQSVPEALRYLLAVIVGCMYVSCPSRHSAATAVRCRAKLSSIDVACLRWVTEPPINDGVMNTATACRQPPTVSSLSVFFHYLISRSNVKGPAIYWTFCNGCCVKLNYAPLSRRMH